MIGLYKDLKAAYMAMLVVLCLCTAINVWCTDELFNTLTLLIILLIFAVCIVLALVAQKRMNGIQKALHDTCQAWECVRAYEKLLNRPAAQRKAVRRILRFNLGTAYSAVGDQRQAMLLTMEYLPIKAKGSRGRQERLLYCNNMAEYYILAGDAENARAAVADIKRALQAMDPKHPQAVLVQGNLNSMDCRLAVLEGEAHGVYRTLEIAYTNAPTPYQRVASGYDLALAYLQLGETEKVIPVLETMVAQGGDTFFAAWAAERLKELQKT